MHLRLVFAWGLVAAAGLAGCDEPGPEPLHVGSAPVVGGPERTPLTVLDERVVVRTELYLGSLRVGADEFAPFEVEWDASGFPEGTSTLRGVAYLADGGMIAGTTEVRVDNTPPTIGDFAALPVRGEVAAIPAADEVGLASVEVVLGDDRRVTASAPGFTIRWDEPCGPRELEVIATDRAGWVTTRVLSVIGRDPEDADCDGHAANLDCDDDDPATHPGAPDDGRTGADHNCDGVPGTDGDGDGVASVATGGGDCDDGNPQVFPGWYRWETEPLILDGAPITWTPGTAAVVMSIIDNQRAIRVAINRSGTIELVTWIENRGVHRETLVTGALPGRVALVRREQAVMLVYARGTELRTRWLDRPGSPDEAVLSAATAIDELAAIERSGNTYLAVRAGGEVWLAERPWSAQSWATSRPLDGVPADAHSLAIFAVWPSPRVGWVERGVMHDVDRSGNRRTRTGGPRFQGGLAGDETGTWIYGYDGALHRDGGTSSTIVSTGWQAIERVLGGDGEVYYQARTADGRRVVRAYRAGRAELEMTDAVDLDAVSPGGPYGRPVIAAPGVFAWVGAARAAPDDPVDGVDRDCDGRD